MGKPSTYSDETADILCEELAQGAALYRLCAERDDLPAERTVYQWLEKMPEFAQKYARARERQQDRESDHIIEIADTEPDPNRARVRIDARKWRASKLAPKRFGERVAHTDADGASLIPAPAEVSNRQLAMAILFMIGQAQADDEDAKIIEGLRND